MKRGYLSQYFESVAAKKLTAVEVDPTTSHGHELNSIKELKAMFGPEDLREMPATFLWFGQENEGVSNHGNVSWYDARRNDPKRSAEWRLYYDDKQIIQGLAKTNDTVFVAKRTDGLIMMIVTAGGSTIESQLFWLFGIKPPNDSHFEFSEIEKDSDSEIGFVSRFILDELGIEVEEPEADQLDQLLERFKGVLPSTNEFSSFARASLKDVNSLNDPDEALLAWMNQEEKLFRRLERHIVSKRIYDGFLDDDRADVDGFMQFALSVQNRRKARAGLAFELHVEEIFKSHKIRFERGSRTEGNKKPDFLFPGGVEYNDVNFPSSLLCMLGVKTTLKDRWRQVLSEANRISPKHLLTLEPGISENQTDEMIASNLQLVVPKVVHGTFNSKQQSWLMSVNDFINMVKQKQTR